MIDAQLMHCDRAMAPALVIAGRLKQQRDGDIVDWLRRKQQRPDTRLDT